jgi:hypothetical protein
MSYLFYTCAALAYQNAWSVVKAFGLARVFSLVEALTRFLDDLSNDTTARKKHQIHTSAPIAAEQSGGGHVATQLSGCKSCASPRAQPRRGRKAKKSFIFDNKITDEK